MKRRTLIIGTSAVVVAATTVGLGIREYRKPREVISRKIDALLNSQTFDVCIIGSGPAGCIVAEKLVAEGFSVAMLESGVILSDSKGMQNATTLDIYESSGEIDYPLQSTRMRALGGTSNIWTGRCPRLLPSDFAENPLSPKGGWPISYQDLKPFYQKAETLLHVTSNDPTAGQAPRDIEFPYKYFWGIDPLKSFLAPFDITVNKPPSSKMYGLLGPIRFARHTLPSLTENINFNLFTDATAVAIESNKDGVIKGVLVKSLAGTAKTIRAKKYVIACGAIESARLLLLSKSPQFPQGLGNLSGQLGRNFMEHPAIVYRAEIPKHFLNYFHGRTYQYCDMLNSEGYGKFNLGFYTRAGSKLKIAPGFEMSPEPSNRIILSDSKSDSLGNPGTNLHFSFSDKDKLLFARGEKLVYEIFGKLNSGPVSRDGDLQSIHWSHHHMGTTRMSEDPNDGVVDANLKVHGTQNLYIASSSVFVTCGASNPTLTIAALSLRLSDHIIKIYKKA